MNSSAPSPIICDDAAFGPVISGCRQDFDFTLAFQQYFFSVVPSLFLLIAAPLRILILRRHEVKLDGGNLLKYAKLATIAVFSSLQLALLVLWASRKHVQGGRSSALASASLTLAASLALLPLSHMEHSRSLRPSLLVSGYLLLTLVLDIATIRTFWLSAITDEPIRATFTAAFALKGVLLGLEAMQKRRFFLTAYQKRSPEEYSGLFGQGLMWWLNSIIFFGARYSLKPKSLYPITADMASEKLHADFSAIWTQQTGPKSLKKALLRLLWWPIVVPILPRLALLAFTMCQPLLIKRLLTYLSDPNQTKDAKVGYWLIGATALVYVGMAISGAVYWHRHYRFMTMIRGTLTTAVYGKALEMNINASTSAKTVTLMSADCERIVRGVMDLHELWANITQVALATWLVEVQLGVACVAPVAVTLTTAFLTGYATMYTPAFQMLWIEKLESRIGVTTSILGAMKAIKISSLTSDVLNLLNKMRRDELAAASKFRFISIITATIGYAPQLLSPVVTFAMFIGIARSGTATLDPARIFTSISLLYLISEPLFNLFAGMMELMSAIGCIARVEQFLQSPSRTDSRTNGRVGGTRAHSSDDEKKSGSNTELSGLEVQNPDRACISVKDGSFGWEDESSPVLRNLNFSVSAGDIVFVKGPVGCGKSTLIKALLGETPLSSGHVMLSTMEVALCEQSPFVMNLSIRDNITYSSAFDADLYATVIDCCQLRPDLASMENGDRTIVGSKGFSLSAGQRQRVALARAVYSRKRIALLDDVFSQLDADTSGIITSRLIGPNGLFRRWETTVILTSSSDRFLPYANSVIELNEAGEIVRQGAAKDIPTPLDPLTSDVAPLAHSTLEVPSNATNPVIKKADDLEVSLTKVETEATDESEATTLEERPPSDISVYKYYLQSVNWKRALIFMVFQTCLAFLSSFPVVWLKWWTDESPALSDNRTSYYIGIYAALQGAGLVASGLVTWWTLNILAVAIGFRLHEVLSGTVMGSTLQLFSSTDSGSILNRFTQDIQLADIQLPLSLQIVVTNLLTLVAQAGLIASVSPWIALSYPVLLAVFYLIPKYYVRTARQMRTLDLEEKAPLYAQFLETLEGMSTIRAFSWLHESSQHNYKLVDKSQKPFYLMYVIQKWLGLVLDFAVACLATLVVGVAVALRETVSPGFTGVSLTQVVSFTSYLKMMILFWAQLQTAMAAVERIRNFSRDTETEEDRSDSPPLEPPASWPARGDVQIEKLSARYVADAKAATLDGVSLEIKAGEHVGICGRTGSGKTSLVLAMMRLLDPSEGSIKIDGLDIASVPRDMVRSRIVGVAEEPFFFPGSVRLNLDPHGVATDEQIIQALSEVKLWGVFEESGGLDGILVREKLSHGQRQLLSIARGLLRDARIYILDEVASSLDAEAEKTVNRIIETRLKGRMVISVVHKMDSALAFQKIVVMEKGKVIEFDDPASLMSRPSKFRELVTSDRSSPE
ncbi:ABC transporter [Rhypophila sp. PSN 637]